MSIVGAPDGTGLALVSDAPASIGEEFTLSLMSTAGELELRVQVTGVEPYVAEGSLRHRLRLVLLSAVPASTAPAASSGDQPETPFRA